MLAFLRPARQMVAMNLQPSPAPYRADPKIASLGDKIGDPVTGADFPKAILRYRNDRWAATVGLDGLSDAEWTEQYLRAIARRNPIDGSIFASRTRWSSGPVVSVSQV